MSSRKDRKSHIIQSALTVLKEVGSEGLTMRLVATNAGMSLGNLQYHFKDKPALLAGMAKRYFEDCTDMLDQYQHNPTTGAERERIQNLISFFMDHVDHISDMCRIFREIWALSTRDNVVHDQLINYYQTMVEKLSEKLAPFYDDPEKTKKAVTLLLPYFEGYSITTKALPLTKDQTTELLTQLSLSFQ